MTKTLLDSKIAMLVASGFNEADLTLGQRALIENGAHVRIISTDNGLTNGWDETKWGHNFAVDAQLNTALGVDYDILVIPGGQRSFEKLKLTAHSKRFVSSFMATLKPVICMGDALDLLALTEQIAGKEVSGPESSRTLAEKAGAVWSQEAICIDHNLMTGACDNDTRAVFIQGMIEMISSHSNVVEAA